MYTYKQYSKGLYQVLDAQGFDVCGEYVSLSDAKHTVNRYNKIDQLNAEIAAIKPKYNASVGHEAYKLGAKLRALQTELNNTIL